ncbi:hypothetical protein H1C71_039314, partial [Ictidomys tridecemlineatus]
HCPLPQSQTTPQKVPGCLKIWMEMTTGPKMPQTGCKVERNPRDGEGATQRQTRRVGGRCSDPKRDGDGGRETHGDAALRKRQGDRSHRDREGTQRHGGTGGGERGREKERAQRRAETQRASHAEAGDQRRRDVRHPRAMGTDPEAASGGARGQPAPERGGPGRRGSPPRGREPGAGLRRDLHLPARRLD